MEALIGGLLTALIAQFSFIWYKLGKIERHLKELNGRMIKEEEKE